jgi:heptosyltransferase-3
LTDDAPWWGTRPLVGSLRPTYWPKWMKKITRIRKEKYDVIIDLRGDLRHLLLFGVAGKPKILLGHTRTGGESLVSYKMPYVPDIHEIDKKLELLKPLGITAIKPHPKIWLLPEEIKAAQNLIADRFGNGGLPVILIDPGAKPIQQWPVERFAKVLCSLWEEFGNTFLISAGPAYMPIAERLGQLVTLKVGRLVGSLSIRQLAALIAACDLVVSADTGIYHVASALGTPAVTLSGPTNPARFWHGVEGSVVVQSPESCAKSELHETCHKTNENGPGLCMSAISEDYVYQVLRKKYKELLSEFVNDDN